MRRQRANIEPGQIEERSVSQVEAEIKAAEAKLNDYVGNLIFNPILELLNDERNPEDNALLIV